MPFVTYECAVYDEICNAATRQVLKSCSDLSSIPDERLRTATLLAVLLTAAQALDGNVMPEQVHRIKPGGVADRMAQIINGCRRV